MWYFFDILLILHTQKCFRVSFGWPFDVQNSSDIIWSNWLCKYEISWWVVILKQSLLRMTARNSEMTLLLLWIEATWGHFGLGKDLFRPLLSHFLLPPNFTASFYISNIPLTAAFSHKISAKFPPNNQFALTQIRTNYIPRLNDSLYSEISCCMCNGCKIFL